MLPLRGSKTKCNHVAIKPREDLRSGFTFPLPFLYQTLMLELVKLPLTLPSAPKTATARTECRALPFGLGEWSPLARGESCLSASKRSHACALQKHVGLVMLISLMFRDRSNLMPAVQQSVGRSVRVSCFHFLPRLCSTAPLCPPVFSADDCRSLRPHRLVSDMFPYNKKESVTRGRIGRLYKSFLHATFGDFRNNLTKLRSFWPTAVA